MLHPLAEYWQRAFAVIPETARLLLGELKVEFAEDQITLIFSNAWIRDYFAEKYLAGASTRIAELSGKKIELVLRSSDAVTQKFPDSGVKPAEKERAGSECVFAPGPAYIFKPRPGFTLKEFVVRDSNRSAFLAASAFAEWREGFNTVIVFGGISTGKTHLTWAAYRRAGEINSGVKILRPVPAKAFKGEFTRLASQGRNANWGDFDDKYFHSGQLHFDDIHHLVGAERTQAQFNAIVESVLDRGAFVMMTSKWPLAELEKQFKDAELVSRLKGSMAVEIEPPDFELKVAILLSKAKVEPMPFELDEELAREIVRGNPYVDARSLAGLIISIKPEVNRGAKIDLPFINRHRQKLQKKLDPEVITKVVAEHFDVSVEAIKSDNKMALIVKARRVAFYLCRKLLPQVNTMDLGRYFKKDHSTVIQGANDIAREKEKEAALAAELLVIEGKILF